MMASIVKKQMKKMSLLIIILLLVIYYNILHNKLLNQKLIKKEDNNQINNYNLYNKIKIDYENNKFAILKDYCKICGLFAFYKHYLACLIVFIKKGYIPIIDLASFPNNLNGFNISLSNKNPWENFFHQPYEYTLENVIKNAKNIKYFKCRYSIFQFGFPKYDINSNNILIDFWHSIALKYIPLKYNILKETDILREHLFKGSKNVLGILARGTDYLSLKPRNHPKPPNINVMFQDIKKMDNINKYDFFFLATEDDLIRFKFKQKFGYKLKYLIKYNNIHYNYEAKKLLCFNKYIKGNLDYITNYLKAILILSKCIDIIGARTSGTIGAFILSNGFRYTKLYYIGKFKKT